MFRKISGDKTLVRRHPYRQVPCHCRMGAYESRPYRGNQNSRGSYPGDSFDDEFGNPDEFAELAEAARGPIAIEDPYHPRYWTKRTAMSQEDKDAVVNSTFLDLPGVREGFVRNWERGFEIGGELDALDQPFLRDLAEIVQQIRQDHPRTNQPERGGPGPATFDGH